MELRPRFPFLLQPARSPSATPVMFLGSCFASEIGYQAGIREADVMTNPHGTLFNPFSVAGALDRFAVIIYIR